jgi:hypothetical protein
MNANPGKLLLATAAAGLLAAGGLLVAAAALWPLADKGEISTADATAVGRRESVGDGAPLASFAPAWSRDLRRPLTDDPASTTTAESNASTLPVRLVGTIIDPVRPRGIFVTVLGQMELRAAGEKAGGAEVLRIEERSATLSIAGRPVMIKLEKAELSVPGSGADPARPPSARSESQPVEQIVR